MPFPGPDWLGIVALIAILLFIFHSSVLEKHSNKMVKNFTDNLSARERLKEQE